MTEKQSDEIKSLIEILQSKKDFNLKMIVGVDGFVDEIIHVVDQRFDFDSYSRLMTIEALGKRVLQASGFSTNIELVSKQTKLGGNGPIFTNALLEYGASLTYIGAIGTPDIHPVFMPMVNKAERVYPLCDPGHTDALEFTDGKLMFGKHSTLKLITWKLFKEIVGDAKEIADMLSKCDLFGMTNWSMIPNMSEIFNGLIEEVFPLIPDTDKKPKAFFDLADPQKRTKEDIKEVLRLIGCFQKKFDTILGLNEKEVYEITNVFGESIRDLESAVKTIFDKLGIYCLVAHPTKEASCCVGREYFHVNGPFCANPVLTTGAGDNFNAGFCLGQTFGLDQQSCLLLGVATSGFYVRKGKSPTFNDILQFLNNWQKDNI